VIGSPARSVIERSVAGSRASEPSVRTLPPRRFESSHYAARSRGPSIDRDGNSAAYNGYPPGSAKPTPRASTSTLTWPCPRATARGSSICAATCYVPPSHRTPSSSRTGARFSSPCGRAWHDGTREILFEPHELIEKLAALIPKPRINLLLYHGVLGPSARLRGGAVAACGTLGRRAPACERPRVMSP
jgi:hypothetical protein